MLNRKEQEAIIKSLIAEKDFLKFKNKMQDNLNKVLIKAIESEQQKNESEDKPESVKAFRLDELSTQELEETGYTIIGKDDEQYCIVRIDGEDMVFKLFDRWSGIKCNCKSTRIITHEEEAEKND